MRYHFHGHDFLRLAQIVVVVWAWALTTVFDHVLAAVILTLVFALTELVLMERGQP